MSALDRSPRGVLDEIVGAEVEGQVDALLPLPLVAGNAGLLRQEDRRPEGLHEAREAVVPRNGAERVRVPSDKKMTIFSFLIPFSSEKC